MNRENRIRATLGVIATCGLSAIICNTAFAQLDPFLDGQVSVRLAPGASIAAFNAQYDTVTLREIPGRDTYLLGIQDGRSPTDVAGAMRGNAVTIWAEENYFGDGPEGSGRNVYCFIIPDSLPYHVQPAWDRVRVQAAHQRSTGQGVRLAVIDTGVDAAHPALAGHILSGGWNFQDNNANVADLPCNCDNDGDGDMDELYGHGTYVSGVALFLAPDAMILPIKVLDSEGNSNNFYLAQGLYYAIDAGVDVINASMGSTYDAKAVEDALEEAQQRGITVVAAAGNLDRDVPEFPAIRPEAIGVASVDDFDIKADFSNFNPGVDLCAPGVGIFSCIPNGLYADLDGTSTSTPMVAGAAALLLSANADWPRNASRPALVASRLRQSAIPVDDLNPPYAGQLGAGRLDARAALDATAVFDVPVAYPVGQSPARVALADFNNDARLDVAVSNTASGDVSILLNAGGGELIVDGSYAAGTPDAIVAARLNGDSYVDLAVVDDAANGVRVLLNNGDGTFSPGAPTPAGVQAFGLASADFDGDGAMDLAATNDETAGVVTILHNNGAGVFTVAAVRPVGSRPRDIVATRLNADAAPDLAVVNRNTNNVSVLLNLGNGTFAPAVAYPVGSDPRRITAGDYDGDGDVDLITANNGTNDLSILTNSGSGSFTPERRISALAGRTPNAVATADLDCDGDADLAVANGESPGLLLSVLINNGSAVFEVGGDVAIGAVVDDVALGDLDDDFDADFVVPDASMHELWTLGNLSCTRTRGDVNCDGMIDFFDVDPFILALLMPAQYAADYAGCDRLTADVNHDGSVDNFDIDGFVQLLLGG